MKNRPVLPGGFSFGSSLEAWLIRRCRSAATTSPPCAARCRSVEARLRLAPERARSCRLGRSLFGRRCGRRLGLCVQEADFFAHGRAPPRGGPLGLLRGFFRRRLRARLSTGSGRCIGRMLRYSALAASRFGLDSAGAGLLGRAAIEIGNRVGRFRSRRRPEFVGDRSGQTVFRSLPRRRRPPRRPRRRGPPLAIGALIGARQARLFARFVLVGFAVARRPRAPSAVRGSVMLLAMHRPRAERRLHAARRTAAPAAPPLAAVTVAFAFALPASLAGGVVGRALRSPRFRPRLRISISNSSSSS